VVKEVMLGVAQEEVEERNGGTEIRVAPWSLRSPLPIAPPEAIGG
jgi:hypothetical protein